MEQKFMQERPVFPLMLSMSLPMVLSMLVNSLYNIVDSFFVAQISENAMTALSLVFPIQNFINAVSIGFGVGINAAISFYLGAKDNKNADLAATQGLVLNVLHGALMTVGCIGAIPVFLRMFTGNAEIIELGCSYSYIAFSFSIIITAELSFEKIFQAIGKMTISMASVLTGCIANIILDPLLIFGYGPFPKMGMQGAALATGIGQVLALAVYLVVYFSKPLPIRISFRHFTAQKQMIRKLYAVGIPATLNLALPSLLISSLNALLAAYSQTYVVILGIYYKLQTFLYLPANGIIQGMRPLIGYNYGANEQTRVRKIYSTGLKMTASIMLLGTVLCLLFPGQLIGMFTSNSRTIHAGAVALRIISAGFVVSAVSVTSAGALEGLGKGTPSLLISLFRYVIIIIPCAFLFSRFAGAPGVWNAFWVSELLTAIAAYFIYRRVTAGKTMGDIS